MKNNRVILIAFLIGITIFSVFKYVSFLKEKRDLIGTVNQMKEEVAVLESEKQLLSQDLEQERSTRQQLSEENIALQENLKVSAEKLVKLSSDFSALQKELEQVGSQLVALKEERDSLNTQAVQVAQERDNLQARLSSIPELKKTIRELKKQMHKVNVEVTEKVKHVKRDKAVGGNLGFLIRDGKSTCASKIRIDVISAAPLTEGTPSTGAEESAP